MKKSKIKTIQEIAIEWDNICGLRKKLIDEEKDISLKYVTAPCIYNNIEFKKIRKILDIGCGTGYLTNLLSFKADFCIGIDISKKSIEIAKNSYNKHNLKFTFSDAINYSEDILFDAITANMVLMTDPNFKETIKKAYALLNEQGEFHFVITHPLFWPKYWGYEQENWFNYNSEIYIESNFKSSLSNSLGITTHIHRPLHSYINTILDVGFSIKKILEPLPIINTPHGYKYDYPRFIYISCVK